MGDRDEIRDDIIFELSHIGVDDDGMVIRVVAAHDKRVAGLVAKLTAARLAEEFAKDSLAIERKLRKQAEAALAERDSRLVRIVYLLENSRAYEAMVCARAEEGRE